jgi:ABC-type lipoprotein release transport system permease subunit
MPVGAVVTGIVEAIVVSRLAAMIIPARRAAQVNILEALHYE